MPSILQSLSKPDGQALADSKKLTQYIRKQIQIVGGKWSFEEFMRAALYNPELGYYMNTTAKFAAPGDFVTAPELSPLFSRCLAAQCAQIFTHLPLANIVEFGAGSGIMAADILLHLEKLNLLPQQYYIVDISPTLKKRQQATWQRHCPHLLNKVSWVDVMPNDIDAIVLLNEILDAMPVEQFVKTVSGFQQRFIAAADAELVFYDADIENKELSTALRHLENEGISFTADYVSEINLQLKPWLQHIAQHLRQGVILCCDYGYARREYYHPQRSRGTLQCHYQHRVHDRPLWFPGLQDITSHVDFTAVAEAAIEGGLEVLGFTLQSLFLLNNGLLDLVSTASNVVERVRYNQQVKQLTLPDEMGERFKVIALGKRTDLSLQGFATQDRSYEL